jgi:hypothetical protein
MARFTDEEMEAMPTEELEGVAMGMAEEVDATEDLMRESVAPEGDFSAAKLNAVVDALNDVLELMGAPEYPTFEEDIEVFPIEFVQQLEMINAALTDAGMDDLALVMAEISDDKDLTLLAGQIASLAGNKDFMRFLKQQTPAAPPEETVEVEETIETPEGDTDALMMQRM